MKKKKFTTFPLRMRELERVGDYKNYPLFLDKIKIKFVG